jgi:hypothetical protein
LLERFNPRKVQNLLLGIFIIDLKVGNNKINIKKPVEVELMECKRCKNHFAEEQIIKTDEFGNLKEPVNYCHVCFIDLIREAKGNFDPGTCTKCGTKLIAVFEDIDDILFEGLVFYYCPNGLKDEDDEHDSHGQYLVQPEEEEGWAGF